MLCTSTSSSRRHKQVPPLHIWHIRCGARVLNSCTECTVPLSGNQNTAARTKCRLGRLLSEECLQHEDSGTNQSYWKQSPCGVMKPCAEARSAATWAHTSFMASSTTSIFAFSWFFDNMLQISCVWGSSNQCCWTSLQSSTRDCCSVALMARQSEEKHEMVCPVWRKCTCPWCCDCRGSWLDLQENWAPLQVPWMPHPLVQDHLLERSTAVCLKPFAAALRVSK
jgi:hypothetical protein